jgi:hypothetical protein
MSTHILSNNKSIHECVSGFVGYAMVFVAVVARGWKKEKKKTMDHFFCQRRPPLVWSGYPYRSFQTVWEKALDEPAT